MVRTRPHGTPAALNRSSSESTDWPSKSRRMMAFNASRLRETIGVVREPRIVLEVLDAHRRAEPRPQARIGHRDDDLAVCRRIRLVGRQRWMLVAEAAGALPGGRDDADRQAEHRHGRVEQRDVEELPLAGSLPLNVREQDALHRVERGQAVGDRHANLGGSGLGEAGDVHQPRLALDHHVVAGLVAARPGRAVPGDRAVDQPRVERRARSGPKPSRSSVPGRKFSITTSAERKRSSISARPSSDFRSTATLFLLRLTVR